MNTELKIKEWDEIHCEKHVTNLVTNITNLILKNNLNNIYVIDIGANVGKVYELLKNNIEIKKVWMFEGSEILFNYIVKKFKDDEKVFITHAVINNNEEIVDFDESSMIIQIESEQSELNFGLSQIKGTNYSKKVKSLMISNFLNENKIIYENFCFIKIDTETVDFNILKDLCAVINYFTIKPLIEFEVNYFTIGMSKKEAQSILDEYTFHGYFKTNLDECFGDGLLIPINFLK